MGERTWISLGVGVLALLVPAAAQAASARVRALNAVASGTVTIQVDARPKAVKLAPGRESERFSVAAGTHTFTALRGKRTVAARRIAVASGERVTVVYASDDGHAEIRLLREPAATAGTTMLRVANYAPDAGLIDVRVGGLVVARGLDYNRATVALRVAPAVSPAGLATVSARPQAGAVLTAPQPLVLATRSVGIFVIVPRGTSSRLLRLAYDTAPPTPTRQPAVTGTRRFGNAVRCDGGAWTPAGATVTRRWTVDGADAGAASSFALTTASSAGHVVGCTVTATSKGMTTKTRVAFALPLAPASVLLPFIEVPAGQLLVGDIASCNTGSWTGSPTGFAIRWVRLADESVIGTGPTFTLGLGQNGIVNSLACEVVATNDGGQSQRARSANTVGLGIAPAVTIVPASKPAPTTVSRDAFFQWSIGGGGADTVDCSLDGAPFGPCIGTLAQTYHLLATSALGVAHTFSVRVTNPVASATDTYPWTVQQLLTSLGVTPGDQEPAAAFDLGYVLTDAAATVTCRLNAAGVLGPVVDPCPSPQNFPDPGPGHHTVTVTASNSTGTDTQSIAWDFLP